MRNRNRNQFGQFVVRSENNNAAPVYSLLTLIWNLINYFVLFILYLSWILTLLAISYFIITYIDFKQILNNFVENHICKCKSKQNGDL